MLRFSLLSLHIPILLLSPDHTHCKIYLPLFRYRDQVLTTPQWTCLDYIFETNASLPRREKGKKILRELQQKTAVYQSMRGMRAPVVMEKHLGQREPRVSDNNTPRDLKFIVPAQESSTDAPSFKPLLYGPNSVQPVVGRVPLGLGQDIQFAGVSNGESLWALPNSQSPEASSDTTSLSGQQFAGNVVPAGVGQQDDLMADIDWDAFDALFPPEQQIEPEITGFPFPGVPGQY